MTCKVGLSAVTLFGTLMALVLAACDSKSRLATPAAQHEMSKPRGAVDNRFEMETATVDSFLKHSAETAPKSPHMFDSLQICLENVQPDRTLWLATARVLSANRAADSTVVAAEIVTVAEQSESESVANAFVVRPRIAIDTLHWTIVQQAGAPRICGFAREGVDFGSYGLPTNTSFLNGATRVTLMHTIDSIRRDTPR